MKGNLLGLLTTNRSLYVKCICMYIYVDIYVDRFHNLELH